MVDSAAETAQNRNSFRINSRIHLAHQKISVEKFAVVVEDCNCGISLYNRQELADIQVFISAQNALSRLQERDNDLAEFLQHLDGKLNLLLKKVDSQPSILDTLVLQTVNIGGNGIAFWNSKPYQPGEILELHLILPPNHSYINCFGKVVKCGREKGSDGKDVYRIAIKFKLVMEKDRELLVQFNFKQQSLALQRRRLEQQQ